MSPRRRSHSHDVSSSSWSHVTASPMRLIMGGGSMMVLCLWIFSSFTFLQDINQQSNVQSHVGRLDDQQVLIARQTAEADLNAADTEQQPPLPGLDNQPVPPDRKVENGAPERRELQVTKSAETWPMQEAFYTSQYAVGDAETSTTIIFNVFKGPAEALRTQLESAASQKGVSPPEIWVMCFNSPQREEYEAVVAKFKKSVTNKVVFTVSDFNHKFHGRFLLAYMATTKYVLIVDDDKYIGENTVAEYIGYMQKTPGVWGNNGHIRAPTFDGYKSWPAHFDTAVDTHAEVDYLCGMWFLEQSWLEYFAKERMPSWETAEDMHLSHVMRKYLNLNTYGGNVALGLPSPPRKKHAATVGKALDLREYIFDHQLGRGNKVANVKQPIDTLVYAETVEDIDNFIAKIESCRTAEAVEKPNLRGEEEEPEPDAKSTAPWCAAGKTAAVFRGGKEQDVVGLIQAAERLCSITQCEYLSVKPKIKHPIRYFNMREGYGQGDVEIPWQTSAADVLTSFVGVLNNILPQRIFVPDVTDVQWPEVEGEKKKNRLQIYHDTIRLAINIHKSTETNAKWDDRDQAAYPSGVQAYVLKHTPTAADETLDRDEESWEQSVKDLL